MKNQNDASQTAHSSAELIASLRDWEAFGLALPHELGSALQMMEAFSSLLLETDGSALSERARRYVNVIHQTAKHLNSLGDALLLMSPMGERPIRRERVNLSLLAHRTVDVLRAASTLRNVEVTVQPGLTAEGDPDLLRALLDNLIGNAWKFTAHRAVARIEFRMVDDEKGRSFCIADNGAGFEMASAYRLFSPFERLHNAVDFPGSGIGLWYAGGIVRRHSGKIWADGQPDVGARFFFSLGT